MGRLSFVDLDQGPLAVRASIAGVHIFLAALSPRRSARFFCRLFAFVSDADGVAHRVVPEHEVSKKRKARYTPGFPLPSSVTRPQLTPSASAYPAI
jgi:hypothetical protein